MVIASAWFVASAILLYTAFTSTSTAFAPTIVYQRRRAHYHHPVPRNIHYLAAKENETTKTKKKFGMNDQTGKGFGRSTIIPRTITEVAEDHHHDHAHEKHHPHHSPINYNMDDSDRDNNDPNSTTSSSTFHSNLVQWLSSHPTHTHISSKFSIKPSALGESCGYGGFANTAISKHELILQIPRQLCVTYDDVLQDPTCGHVFQSIKNQRVASWGMILLAGWIAKEYVIAQECSLLSSSNMDATMSSINMDDTNSAMNRVKHNPYLQSLPWTPGGSFSQDHILLWSEEKVEALLGGSKAYEDAILIRHTVEYATKLLVDVMVPIIMNEIRLGSVICRSDDDRQLVLSPANSDIEAGIRERYIHAVKGAFVIALSRSFAEEVESDADDDGNTTIETENVLLPLIDILQHFNTPNTILESYDDYVVLRARRDIDVGEELFHQYQEEREDVIPPHKFFTRYGFIPGITEPIFDLLERRSDLLF